MKSFSMLRSGPAVEYGFKADRWYIDGERVTEGDFRHMMTHAKRQDTFHSETRKGRSYCRSVCYI